MIKKYYLQYGFKPLGAFWSSIILVGLTACGGGGGSPAQPTIIASSTASLSSSSSNTSTSSNASSVSSTAVANVSLQGMVTYDLVKPTANNNGQIYLDYANAQITPARGVTVELLDSLNNTIASTSTDNNGEYDFTVAPNRAVKVRVKAQLDASNYSIAVKDNTQNNALYVLDGSLAGSGSAAEQTRNLHANLGWNIVSQAYSSERQSAPFAILDALYDSLTMVIAADATANLPPLDVFWSVNNVALNGSFSEGNIGSSLYSTGASAIYILGHANNDTDEFDNTVVQHEFGHYLEDKLSRSESIGGVHYLGAPVDMRVAFGEGFGNAFAAMSSGEPLYLDTSGAGQQSGFGFNIETNRFGGGYYSEGAIHSVLYDLFDDGSESGDNINLGFAPILAALRHDDYITFDGYTSIYAFANVLKSIVPESESQINELLMDQNIVGTGMYGEGETATGTVSFSLPIYQRLAPGETIEACSNNNLQEYNGLEVRRYVLLEVPSTGTYTIRAQRKNGIQPSDPDFQMHREGTWAGASEGSAVDVENWTKRLEQGVYALNVYDAFNTDEDDSTGGLVCFNVTLN